MDERFLYQVSNDRIDSRQIDELIGLARGLVADGMINQAEVEFLQKWLVANIAASNHPMLRTLYQRVAEILSDGQVDDDEKEELLDTLNRFSNRDFELGETLKASTLPLCDPSPTLSFVGKNFCFTGTFNFGQRKHCEDAVFKLGALAGSLNRKTDYLVIGVYATESWKHSSFGNKIIKAVEMREAGIPIHIISEDYWRSYL